MKPTTIMLFSIAAVLTACSPNTDTMSRTGGVAGSAGTLTPSATQSPSLLPPVDSEPSTAVAGCSAGEYTGTYEAPLWGTGPLNFELTQASAQASNCGEFCPDLTITDGGSFVLTWAVFEGGAKLTGGLDCSTGEFRADLVDGNVHLVGGSTTDGIFQLGGTLEGQFMANPARIVGSFMFTSVLDASGTFTVML